MPHSDAKYAHCFNAHGQSPLVLICEHASCHMPVEFNQLGLAKDQQTRHIAWDIGALPVAMALAEKLDAPLVHQGVSRLLYDCNRPPSALDAIPERSEVTEIPGNLALDEKQRQQRIDDYYRPFHHRVSELLEERKRAGQPSIVVTIHSFNPTYKGETRQLHLGILSDSDERFTQAVLEAAKQFSEVITRHNEPYAPSDGVTHTLQLHGLSRGLHHTMVEIRNDLIDTVEGQQHYAELLTQMLETAAANTLSQT